MKDFVAENLFEDRARRRIVVHETAVDLKPSGGRLLGDMEKCEQAMIGLAFDAKIVEPVATRKRVAVEERRRTGRAHAQQRGAPLAKQHAVMELVDRMFEIESAKQRIGREL